MNPNEWTMDDWSLVGGCVVCGVIAVFILRNFWKGLFHDE